MCAKHVSTQFRSKLGKCQSQASAKVRQVSIIFGNQSGQIHSYKRGWRGCMWRVVLGENLVIRLCKGVVWENFVVNFVNFPFILMICSWCSYEIQTVVCPFSTCCVLHLRLVSSSKFFVFLFSTLFMFTISFDSSSCLRYGVIF